MKLKNSISKCVIGCAFAAAAFSSCRTSPDATENASELDMAGGHGKPGGPTKGMPAKADATIFEMSGLDAKVVYEAMKTAPDGLVRGTEVKYEIGRIDIKCSETGLPPGAMGFPAPTKRNCTVAATGNTPMSPPGMTVARARPIVFIDDSASAATTLTNAMDRSGIAPRTWNATDRRYVREYSRDNARFSCSEISSSTGAKYACRFSGPK